MGKTKLARAQETHTLALCLYLYKYSFLAPPCPDRERAAVCLGGELTSCEGPGPV